MSAKSQIQQEFVQQINASSGLYLDSLGQIKISSGQLNILIPLDISHFKPYLENIENAINKARALCLETNVIENLECHSITQPLVIRYHDIIRQFTSISELLDTKAKRSAWFGGVGTVIKHIFGNLDETDGLRYDEAIDAIQYDQNKVATLIKENVMVTTSVISSYNKTINNIKINEANLNTAINNLSEHVKNISSASNELYILSSANQVIHYLETNILAISFQLEDIINAILFSSQNILHPSIITPRQLFHELANNVRLLDDDKQFPVPLEISSMHVIMNVSNVVSYFSKNRIIFVLRIPLVCPIVYNLYHALALPTPHEAQNPRMYSMLIPSSKYIAMTRDKTRYCTLDDLNVCKILHTELYICDIVTIYPTSINPSCEVELMIKVTSDLPVQCNNKFIYGSVNVWQTISNNRWIFVQSNLTKVSVDCPKSELYEFNIIGTGILNIPHGCTGYTKDIKFISKYVNNITITEYTLDFNINNKSCCNTNKIKNFIDSVSPTPVVLKNIDLDDLSLKNNEIILDSILSGADDVIHTPHIVKYGIHYSTVTILLLICLFSYLAFKLYVKCKPGSTPKDIDLFKRMRFKSKPATIEEVEYADIPEVAPASVRRHL